ncbi:MAG: DnaJ domain-containing protein [Gammaproteobacteria bacterium]
MDRYRHAGPARRIERIGGIGVALMLALLFNREYRKAIAGRLSNRDPQASVPDGGRCQQSFSLALFAVMGRLAKLDSPVSPAEVRYASNIIHKLGLRHAARHQAIACFDLGKRPHTDVLAFVADMARLIGKRSELADLFMRIQCGLVFLHGDMNLEQKMLLRDMAGLLGFSTADFLSVCAAMSHNIERRQPARTFLQQAYKVLGLEPGAAETEIRKAYLRMMSRYHPDKLMQADLTEEGLREAQQQSLAIREAYETLSAHTA